MQKRRQTTEEKKLAKAKRKVADAKRVLNTSQKKLKELAEKEVKEPSITVGEGTVEPQAKADPNPVQPTEVIFKPNDGPQTDFLAAPEREVLYGGAAGGGKTVALTIDPLRHCNNVNQRALIIRHTNDELREIKFLAQKYYPKAYPGAKWSDKSSTWTFPSGATIWLTYLDREEDVTRYQGQAFTYIGADELTHYRTPYAWNYLRSRLRTADESLPLYMRATTNPGGPGHRWVKKMFVDPAPYGVPFWATDIETGEVIRYPDSEMVEAGLRGRPVFKRRFIPANLTDNPYLDNGDYLANLLSLPEVERKRLLEGNWDIDEGAAFSEFNRLIHTCDPFPIPSSWRRFRAGDYGYSSPSGIVWFAIDPVYGTLYLYRELYVSRYTARDLAMAIINLETEEKIQYGVLDSSLWARRGDTGPSLAEQMISVGCRWRQADRSRGSRVAGKNEIHRLLQVDEATGKPGLVIFKTCTNVIAQLPILQLDKNNPEDVDTKGEDHLYDAIRYGVMTRPRPMGVFENYTNNISAGSAWQPVDTEFGY